MSTLDDRLMRMVGAEQRASQAADRAEAAALQFGGGGGTSGEVTEDWKADVDRRLGELHADIRALLKAGVAAVVALAALIGGLYLYSNGKFDRVGERLGAIEVQQQRTDGKLDVLLERTKPR